MNGRGGSSCCSGSICQGTVETRSFTVGLGMMVQTESCNSSTQEADAGGR
jgi:hypothetical protein